MQNEMVGRGGEFRKPFVNSGTNQCDQCRWKMICEQAEERSTTQGRYNAKKLRRNCILPEIVFRPAGISRDNRNTVKAKPTEEQRRLFCEMMYRAFLDLRNLGSQGKSEQAKALADAFHNLPVAMFQSEFDWQISRAYFQSYHAQYPLESAAMMYDYVAMHDRVEALD